MHAMNSVEAQQATEVYIHDGMYPPVSTYTKKQIAALLCTKKHRIILKIMGVQIEAESSTCGLFVIVYAISIVSPQTYFCLISG